LPPPEWNHHLKHVEPPIVEKQTAISIAETVKPEETAEDISRRTGDTTVYLYYINAVGWIPTLIFVVSISAFVFCISFPTIWVKWWATANTLDPNGRLGYYLGIYAVLGVLALVSLVISCWELIINMVPKSGENFHWVLLKTVMSAPMSFFSTTDTGETVNRFSQDLMLIDMELPVSALNTFATFVLCIAQMILIGVASVYAAIAFPVILTALYFIQMFYLRTSRQLRFLDLEAKSPLYSQFMEILNGLATVRAFGWQNALEEKNRELLDQSQKPFYLLFAVQRWLTLVLDLMVAATAVLLITLVVKLRGTIGPGFVGVALLNVILFSQSIKMLLSFWTNLETHIGSIARIKGFTTSMEPENQPSENSVPPTSWPAHGAIEFRSLSAEYKPNEPVLNHVSLSIEAGQKVGLCGRTGSGKSSLVMSIFRMIEMSAGSIVIDGLDISAIPREEIRSRIVGVPQDSYLLTGSVRVNADPKKFVADGAIIDALKSVQLWENVKEKGGLDTDIEKMFLSHGQKQLFCLARAMLRPSTILILDEATSR
jgi:ATP-binding cassette subfamily C (CFTR/MRP) protein 1